MCCNTRAIRYNWIVEELNFYECDTVKKWKFDVYSLLCIIILCIYDFVYIQILHECMNIRNLSITYGKLIFQPLEDRILE